MSRIPSGVDFILNGQGHGNVAQALIDGEGDLNLLRPWKGDDGLVYVNQPVVNSRGVPEIDDETNLPKYEAVPIHNAVSALRREDWIAVDETVRMVALPRLRAVGDLRGAGLQYVIPNGFGKTVLQHERMTDITDAEIAMDPNKETLQDRLGFDYINLPLPIIHKDFSYPTRQLAISRNGSTPLDTTHARVATRKVAELAERLLLGTAGSFKYGGGFVYGYTNFPSRLTKALTLPTAPGWTPDVLVDEVLEMIELSQLAYHYGPWMLYFSPLWTKYLSADYSTAKGDNTLRQRLLAIEGIQGIRTLDYLSAYKVLLIEFDSETVQEVIGMDITTVQWEPSPFKVNFKVMAIMVPRLMADINGNCGIVDGTAS